MDTPRLRPPRPPQLSKAASPPFPPSSQAPQPASGATSPSPPHDFSVAPSPIGGGHLLPFSMSRTPVVGRVGSDLSHLSHARTSHHHHATTSNRTTGSKDSDNKDRAKSKASSPAFFSGLGAAWRKDVTGKQQAAPEERRKDNKAKRALEVGQWVKRHMAAMVEQLRASFSRQAERDRREQRRRPHSFSGHGPSAARDRGRWRQRRGQLASAPASLRVSPANSGHLSVGGSVKVSTSSDESTMEELQSAIEAAIAHCKNSISVAKQQTTPSPSFSKPLRTTS